MTKFNKGDRVLVPGTMVRVTEDSAVDAQGRTFTHSDILQSDYEVVS